MNVCAEQRGNPHAHKLAEEVTKRHQIEKTQRMNEALPLQVRLDALFQGLKVGKNVSVGDDNASGLSRRARGKNNLSDGSAIQRRRWVRVGGMLSYNFPQRIENNLGARR